MATTEQQQNVPEWWPEGEPVTPPDEREPSNRYSYERIQPAEATVYDELERLGEHLDTEVRDIRIDRRNGPSRACDFPGVVVHWVVGGEAYALPCDNFDSRAHNLRACSLAIKRKRLVVESGAITMEDEYSDLERLPSSTDGDAAIVAGEPEPHQVLGVDRDADDWEVEDAFREKAKTAHPDRGGNTAEFDRLKEARDAMLGGD